MDGRRAESEAKTSRGWWDWVVVLAATGAFVLLGSVARVPQLSLHWGAIVVLTAASLGLLVICGLALWRTTRFQ
jgi:hypothetical protein